jgi:hypothetical protein
MMASLTRSLALTLVAAALWQYAVAAAPPDVPPTLHPPAGEHLKIQFAAEGVQIYQCQGTEWKLQAPDARLFDRHRKAVGKHYGGPTWESSDGSSVVGELVARENAPHASAVPWLLLRVKSTSGQGIFSDVTSIQRLQTRGGQPPAGACDASGTAQTVRVPYSARYYFYTAGS